MKITKVTLAKRIASCASNITQQDILLTHLHLLLRGLGKRSADIECWILRNAVLGEAIVEMKNNKSIFCERKLQGMKTVLKKLVLLLSVAYINTNIYAREYSVPPSSITSANVPWIPDAEMERCVKIYNEAKWLAEDINRATVNQYRQASVNAYNSKVARHSKMTNYFNINCAGKQSESAYRAAQKLNQR